MQGKRHAEDIGFFIVREREGTAELEVVDAPLFGNRAAAQLWVELNGATGVDYFVCAPVLEWSVLRGR